jgi:methyl-accepting chemotaxis protein
VIGLFAVARTASMRDATAKLGDRLVPATRVIGDLKDLTGKYRRDQILYVANRENSEADVQESADSAASLLAEYRRSYVSGPADERAMAAFEAAWADYLDKTGGYVELARGDMDGITRIISLGAGDAAWEDVKATLKAWSGANEKIAQTAKEDAIDLASGTRTLTLVLLLAGIALAAVVATLLIRGISRGMRQLVRAARGIAEGDIEQDLTTSSRDEIGDAVAAFGDMVDYLRDSATAADRIAAGDLTVDIEPRSERDSLGLALRGVTTSLRSAIGDVAGSASSVTEASEQMAGTADEAGRAVGEIATAMGDIASGAERQVQSVHAPARRSRACAAAWTSPPAPPTRRPRRPTRRARSPSRA